MTVAENEIHYLEIVTPDLEAARDLYAKAYGWTFGDSVPELGNAYVASLPNGSRCGIRAPMHDQETPTVRPYVRVTDIDTAVAEAVELGAELALGATEIPGQGSIAIYIIGGIQQGLWQVP